MSFPVISDPTPQHKTPRDPHPITRKPPSVRSYVDSYSVAACFCHAPVTTPTPHSPSSVESGHDASSGRLAVASFPFIVIPVSPGVDVSSVKIVVTEVPFISFVGQGHDTSSELVVIDVFPFKSVPTPQHKTPKDPRPSTRKPPSVTDTPPRSPMPSHNPLLEPTPPVLSPLLHRRAITPRHHTRPHTLSSLTVTHTPTPVTPVSCAHRLVLRLVLMLSRLATTPTPHSPLSVGSGADAVSVDLSIEPLTLVGTVVSDLEEWELPVATTFSSLHVSTTSRTRMGKDTVVSRAK